jgi:hypothetical protein
MIHRLPLETLDAHNIVTQWLGPLIIVLIVSQKQAVYGRKGLVYGSQA